MGSEWTLGAVGPSRRAVMRHGLVWAVVDGENMAAEMVEKLNASGPTGVASVMRDELDALRLELIQDERNQAVLTREDVIGALERIAKTGQEGTP